MIDHTRPSKISGSSATLPILIISLCAAFMFYKYVLQIYPSIITHQLMNEFKLTGVGLGNLAATFYYAYMITQLFVGVLLDKYSVRWITSSAIFACAFGVFLFSQAQSLAAAEWSRALMGVGVAFSTVAYMKLAALWFPPRQYAFISGLLVTASMTGAVFGEAPLSALMGHYGWRESLYYVGIVGFILTALFLIFVRDIDSSSKCVTEPVSRRSRITVADILTVLRSKTNWLLTGYAGLAFSPVVVFGGLWGTPFLQQAYSLSKTQAASMLSLIFVGLGIGSPILGIISDRIGERRNIMIYCTLFAGALLLLVLYRHPMPTWILGILLLVFGFALGSFMLVFTLGKELNQIALTATVIAMVNTSDAALTAVTEPAIGKLLDLAWDGKIVDGVHYFSLHSYHIALSVLPIYLIVGSLMLLWVKNAED